MRDPERIERILNLIVALWKRNPDMRLGQLLYNYGGFKDGDYNTEDDETEKNLEESVRKFKYTGGQ
jgi:uncharacterized protein YihD (DUF1040 family)